jgi:hypothetical protein
MTALTAVESGGSASTTDLPTNAANRPGDRLAIFWSGCRAVAPSITAAKCSVVTMTSSQREGSSHLPRIKDSITSNGIATFFFAHPTYYCTSDLIIATPLKGMDQPRRHQ